MEADQRVVAVVVVPHAPHCCTYLLRSQGAILDQIGLSWPWHLRIFRMVGRAWHVCLPHLQDHRPEEALKEDQHDPPCPPLDASGGEQEVLPLYGGPCDLQAGHVLGGAVRCDDGAHHR